jgi:hypothetical protein
VRDREEEERERWLCVWGGVGVRERERELGVCLCLCGAVDVRCVGKGKLCFVYLAVKLSSPMVQFVGPAGSVRSMRERPFPSPRTHGSNYFWIKRIHGYR